MVETGALSGSEIPQSSAIFSKRDIFKKLKTPKVLFPVVLALIALLVLGIVAARYLGFPAELLRNWLVGEFGGKSGELDLGQIEWANFINTDDVRDVVVDGDILWIGTLGGLLKFDRVQNKILATYSMADGLVSNTVFSLEKQGDILWVGMSGGINRFDTKTGEWRKFTVEEGLVNGANIGLALDGEDLWVGTYAGVGRYNTQSGIWTNFRQEGWNVDGNVFVDTNAIWVLVPAGGAARFDKETGVWEVFGRETLAGGTPYRIDVSDLVIGPRKVWVSTIDGTVNEYDKESATWKELVGLKEQIQTLGGQEYVSIELLGYEEPYLVGSAYSYEFFFLYNSENGDLTQVSKFDEDLGKQGWQILYRLRDFGNNDFWFSLKKGEEVYALAYFDAVQGSWEVIPYRQNLPAVYFSVLASIGEELLVSTNRALELFNPVTFEFKPLENTQPLGFGLGFGEAFYDQNEQKIWILDPGYGMSMPSFWEYDFSSKNISEINPPASSGEVWSTLIGFPQKDQLWLLGRTKLFRYTPSTEAWESFDVGSSDLDQDREAKIWVVTEQGVGEFSEGVVTYLKAGEGIPSSFTKIEVGEDALWLATSEELFSYDLKTKTWKKHDFPFGPPEYSPFPDWDLSPVINDLEFEDGKLWVATSRGLSVFDGSIWRLYTAKEGLLGDNVGQIAFLSGKPWVIISWGGLAGVK